MLNEIDWNKPYYWSQGNFAETIWYYVNYDTISAPLSRINTFILQNTHSVAV